jgi:hypothetical protein
LRKNLRRVFLDGIEAALRYEATERSLLVTTLRLADENVTDIYSIGLHGWLLSDHIAWRQVVFGLSMPPVAP